MIDSLCCYSVHSSILEGYSLSWLFYFAQSPFVLHAFYDVDWARDPIDRRSTTGYCFLLGFSLISWGSKKQTIVAYSCTEMEYRALADTTSELIQLRWLLKDLDVSTSSTKQTKHNKHIKIDGHFIYYHFVHGAFKPMAKP